MKTYDIIRPEPFLNQEQFEKIQKRLNAVPNLQFEKSGSQDITYDGKIYLKVLYLNGVDFYQHVVEDMNALVEHVKNAESVNNQMNLQIESLIKKNEELQEMVNLLTKKLQGSEYDKGGWVLDV